MVRSSAGGPPAAAPPRRGGLRLRERDENEREREPRRRAGERDRRGETERELGAASDERRGIANALRASARRARARAWRAWAARPAPTARDRARARPGPYERCAQRCEAAREAHRIRVARARSSALRRLGHGIRGWRRHVASVSKVAQGSPSTQARHVTVALSHSALPGARTAVCVCRTLAGERCGPPRSEAHDLRAGRIRADCSLPQAPSASVRR